MHWIVDITSKSSHGWHVPLPLLEAQGYGKASKKVLSIWLPKQAYKPLPPYNPSKQLVRPPETLSSKYQSQHGYKSKWVPKDLLKAQGYYKGTTIIWLPQKQCISHKASPKPPAMPTRILNSSHQWKRKQPPPTQVKHDHRKNPQKLIMLNNG